MDNKTILKVVNGMAEKIEALETNIKELEQKANRTGQFHLDAINEKFDVLESKNYQIKSDLDKLINNNEGGNNE